MKILLFRIWVSLLGQAKPDPLLIEFGLKTTPAEMVAHFQGDAEILAAHETITHSGILLKPVCSQ